MTDNIIRTSSIFIINNHKILLLLRDNKEGVPSPNTWCLIGGFVDEGETEEEAARREAEEETGLIAGDIQYLGTHEYATGRTTATFLTVITDAETKSLKKGEEGQEIKFFSFEELGEIPLSGSIKMYYNEYRDQLRTVLETEQPVLIK